MESIFVLGGCRSGKSEYALDAANEIILCDKKENPKGYKPGVFIATAEPFDDEMQDRIHKHRKERGPDWQTLEAPTRLCEAVKKAGEKGSVILLDCVTVWLTNLMVAGVEEKEIMDHVHELSRLMKNPPAPFITVSNEVGMGIVPENKLSRQFRDIAGYANQKLAAASGKVVLVAAGIPMVIKDLS